MNSGAVSGLLNKTALLAALSAAELATAQVVVVSVTPDADSFVRSAAPDSNYGGGGALSVSGSAAVNGSGQQNGLFDTLIRFPTSNVVSSLNQTFGSQDWLVTGFRLLATELAAPDNAMFNRGVGAFEIRWLAADNWLEGTGKPIAPTNDGATWQDLPTILNSNMDVSLGVFTNSGADGLIAFALPTAESFLNDVRSGGEVSLYLTAQSPQVGFTFNSRDFANSNSWPTLEVFASHNPRPRIDSISLVRASVWVKFGTVSNWNYIVQGANGWSESWSNLLTVAAQPTNGQAVFVETTENRQKLYRLSVSP